MKSIDSNISVCHLISGDLWAGAEVMAYHLIRALTENRTFSISAIILNNGRLATELKNAGIDVTIFEENRHSFIVLVFKIFKHLRLKKIDILHSHRRKENMLGLLVSILLGKVKLVTTLHGMPETFRHTLNLNKILNEIDFFTLSHMFHITVAVSNEIRNDLIHDRKFKPNKTTTIHNGIPLHPLIKSETKGKKKSFIIGTAGRLVRVKDFDLFIDIANVLSNNTNIHFLLAGDGPLSEELKLKVEKLNLQNVSFIGHIEDMDTFYSKIDIYMNTSIHEGIPMTILEAMSQRKPVIAPQTGGMPEIIDNGISGFLIPDREPQHFAEKCTDLFSDHTLYERLAVAAEKKIKEQFSTLAMRNKYLETYADLIKCPKFK